MKFCPHCGNSNDYQMPYCTHCGRQLALGDSLDYKQAKKNFEDYLAAHPNEKTKFEHKHFQLCSNCHRKCLLGMDFCPWCGAALDHQDQYENYKFLVTTADLIPGFTYNVIGIINCVISRSDTKSVSDAVTKAKQNLRSQCLAKHGNSVIGFTLLIDNNSNVIAYGTAVNRKPNN